MFLGALFGLAGAAMSASAANAQGKAERQAAEYNAQLMRNKAQNIAYARSAETTRNIEDFRKMRASQRAGFLASGARTDVGSPLTIQLEEISSMQLDMLNDQRARIIEEQGALANAEMEVFQGRMAERARKAEARATLLGGVGKFIGTFD